MNIRPHHLYNEQQGQVALLVVFFVLVISLTVGLSFAFVTVRETALGRDLVRSKKSFAVSEGGIEDLVYRVKSAKQYDPVETVSIGSVSTQVTTAAAGADVSITSLGDVESANRHSKVELTNDTTGVGFFYGVQVGEGGLIMDNSSVVTGNIFSNGNIAAGNSSRITGDTIVATGVTANPSVEWTNHDANFFFASTTASRDIAQSFIANANGPINKASVFLGKVGNPNANITLRIVSDDAGNPSRVSLASVAIAPGTVGLNAGWIDVFFASPANAVNGTKYWMVLDYGSNSAANYWNWRRDSTNAYANNTGKYTEDWNANNANWTPVNGDLAFRVWIGGVSSKIDGATIGNAASGKAYADLFVNTSVHGAACPNQFCITNEPQVPQPLPLSAGQIQDFKDDASVGVPINGDFVIDDDVSLGPKKITGNLTTASNDNTLTITGTIYVQGNIDFPNTGTKLRCAAAYGANSCLIVADGWIDVKNNAEFFGSGQPNSYIMLLSTSACDGTSAAPPCDTAPDNGAMEIRNNALGVIFYAANGLLTLWNGVNITEATAYKLHLRPTAEVEYQLGLANVNFSSGPSGGRRIVRWREIP